MAERGRLTRIRKRPGLRKISQNAASLTKHLVAVRVSFEHR